jgi:pyruvate-ferredoxin/flavodoxin oxidoreductase
MWWHLWRYDPRLETEGKNPFQLDSKDPDWTKFQDFLKWEQKKSQHPKSVAIFLPTHAISPLDSRF